MNLSQENAPPARASSQKQRPPMALQGGGVSIHREPAPKASADLSKPIGEKAAIALLEEALRQEQSSHQALIKHNEEAGIDAESGAATSDKYGHVINGPAN